MKGSGRKVGHDASARNVSVFGSTTKSRRVWLLPQSLFRELLEVKIKRGDNVVTGHWRRK